MNKIFEIREDEIIGSFLEEIGLDLEKTIENVCLQNNIEFDWDVYCNGNKYDEIQDALEVELKERLIEYGEPEESMDESSGGEWQYYVFNLNPESVRNELEEEIKEIILQVINSEE